MIGRTISHYEILEKIGEGGMGEVYLAEDLKLRRRVALKFLPLALTADPERKDRFLREARAAANLEHPHMASIHEVDEVEGVLELARLLEKEGDREAARREYERFLQQWKNADPDLPELRLARDGLERLRTSDAR